MNEDEDALAPESIEELSDEPVVVAASDAAVDIDPLEWLAGERQAAGVTGYVTIEGRRLKIAPVTEAEDNRLLKASRRPDGKGKVNVDYLMYRRLYIAHSLTKANPQTPISEAMLNEARSGYLSQIQKGIQDLSGHQSAQVVSDPFGSSS